MENQPVWTSLRRDPHLRSQEQALLSKDLSQQVNSEDSTTEVICPLLLSTDHKTEFTGKLRSNSSIITIICQYSLKASEKSKTHTDFWLYKESSTCSKREVLKFYPSFPNSSSPLRLPWTPEMAKLSQSPWKSYKPSWLAQTLLVRLLCPTIDKSCPWWTYSRSGIRTWEIRLITARGKVSTWATWSNRPSKCSRSTEEKMLSLTSSIWSLPTRAVYLTEDHLAQRKWAHTNFDTDVNLTT